MNFDQQIQQWIAMDNQLKLLNEKAKTLRENKAVLSQAILTHAQKNKVDSLQIGTEKIKFATTKIQPPISLKYLDTCLKSIIKNEEQVERIMNYIKDKRETKTTLEIKRFSDK